MPVTCWIPWLSTVPVSVIWLDHVYPPVAYPVVSARWNTVEAVIATKISLIVIATADGGLAGSLLVYCAETPVPTCRPSEFENTTLHWIADPPNGAVTDTTSGSD